jgi:hypothetical protein
MAPAKSIKLSIPSSSKSLKLIWLNRMVTKSLMDGKKKPNARMIKEKRVDTTINPIVLGNLRILKLI